MSNVKLAIRVRPFTERELKSEKERVPVVNVIDDHTVTITNIKVSLSGAGDSRERVRRYHADYTFDSACSIDHPGYASQEKVFEMIGREVVTSVTGGASACVLAYGQSATGKTHTMMGTADQPGLIPRLCRAFAENALDITISFLEIYNERVHDLLAGEPLTCHSLPRRLGNARKDLRVREHPDRGPYVQNLRRVAVSDVESLLLLVEEGARRRHTAATRRNPTSSRSHALLELATPRATLHLADLAGSEKASWEGCGGGRQKEGANINKSLVALSNVISALVSGGGRGKFVPYRDSALTWLLKDCFTGGASTFIIATVSPSVACYGESASTLRWAERARQLRTPRVLACSPSTASRAALQAQLNQLLVELAKNHILYDQQTGQITFDDNHWMLNTNFSQNVQPKDVLNTEDKIGNLINMFNPKPDAPNSESTASSIASSSSDVINVLEKDVNLKEQITQEVDKLLAPALERTKSGSDIEIMAPLRHKRRHYKSQEVLPIDKTLQVFNETAVPPSSSASQQNINAIGVSDKFKQPHVPILYDNQRAEIVASVTERLYSKLKKKEEAAVSKVENLVDRKIMEPLSELRICTNARQRLMEISQKAMRNKRRIGIPAHTQTRAKVTRVRDQSIDVQTDLQAYIYKKDPCFTVMRDVGTETAPFTPRCKEIATGPKFGSLDFNDRGTLTESKQVIQRNAFMMTDVITKCDRCSQTPVVPPPRRRKHVKDLKTEQSNECLNVCRGECSISPVISINISQHVTADSDTQSSDENNEGQSSDETLDRGRRSKPTNVSTTPDLLTNHNNVDTSAHEDSESDLVLESLCKKEQYNLLNQPSSSFMPETNTKDDDEFSEDSPDRHLPRVIVSPSKVVNQEQMKDMILGRNKNMYPYNIILSPPIEKDNVKRIVKFKDDDAVSAISVGSQTNWASNANTKLNINYDAPYSGTERPTNNRKKDTRETESSDTTISKVETDSFIWKTFDTNNSFENPITKKYNTPVYKGSSRYRTARSKIYREFLGLETNDKIKSNDLPFSSLINGDNITSSESTDNELSQQKFRQNRQFFEEKLKQKPELYCRRFDSVERNILNACKNLDSSVRRYDNYLASYHVNNRIGIIDSSSLTPKEYLHHLVKLRREMVQAECDTTDDSSVGVVHK